MTTPRNVFICSGHMIDAPGRKQPRFPSSKEPVVRASIAEQLRRWGTGAGDVGICGGARGADILFAEECIARGARMVLLVALPEEEFLERSVRLPGSDWETRYRALRATCETHFQHEEWRDRHPELDVFSRNNLWCIEMAAELVRPESIHALLVWDELPTGDGPGGTSDFARRIRARGGDIAIINPLTLERS